MAFSVSRNKDADRLSPILTTKEYSSLVLPYSPEGVWRMVAPRLIHDALRKLFEEKHLYQSVRLADTALAQNIIEYWRTSAVDNVGTNYPAVLPSPRPSPARAPAPAKPDSPETRAQHAKEKLALLSTRRWYAEDLPDSVVVQPASEQAKPVVKIPTGEIMFSSPRPVCTYCPSCKTKTAFNPVSSFGFDAVKGWTGTTRSKIEQHFGYCYECQQCPGPVRGRVVFMVVRRDEKLTLFGRDPLESVPVEKYIPEPLQQFISGAIIAHHAGQTLSGLFQLRTFIEQFWRLVPEIEKVRKEAAKTGKRLTGEELGKLYIKLLPEPFKLRFPSLEKIYGNLSAAMHDAKQGEEAAAILTAAQDEVNEHFDALRVFKLTPWNQKS